MSAIGKKKLRKLRKRRIWPSVLMFITSLLVSLFVVFYFFSMYLIYFVQAKYSDSFDESDRFTASAVTLRTGGCDWDEVVDFIRVSGGKENVAIVDSSFNVISGCGELTFKTDGFRMTVLDDFLYSFLPSDSSVLDEQAGHMLVLDKSTSNEIGSYNNSLFMVDVENIVLEIISDSDYLYAPDAWLGQSIRQITYWTCSPISETGKFLMIKNEFSIFRKDIYYILTACTAALFLLCIPVIVLLINVVTNIVAQRGMREMLYTDEVTGGRSWL
ncbi:MAG: hypothetical protein ACI4Q4_09215 [Oscillospiraceae bacterium]